MVERVDIVSSNIRAIAYDTAEYTLEVVFKPNKFGICHVWHYKPVTQETYAALIAESEKVRQLVPGASVGHAFAAIKAAPHIVSYKFGEEPAQAVNA